MKVPVCATFFILLLSFAGCGVKSPPVAPEGTSIPSVVDKYKDPDPREENEDKQKKSQERDE